MNNEILNKRWQEVDMLLSTFYVKNTKINTLFRQNVQDVFNGINYTYEELFSYADLRDIMKLRLKINELRDKYTLEGYTGMLLREMVKKQKMRNSEVLIGLLMVEYYRQYKEQDIEENKLFDEISNLVYTKSQEETIEALPDKKKKKRTIKVLPIVLLSEILALNSYRGYKWKDFKDGTINYNVRQLFDVAKTNMQTEKVLDITEFNIKKVLDKQHTAYLNKKDRDKIYEDYKNDFSGSLDNQIAFIVNQIALRGMKIQGCTKVQFIAVMDEKTTDMCQSLDGQIFDIYNWNTYSRYSKADGKNIIYHTKGLETGANLPPIDNGFHWCRSTIYPYR